MKGAQSLEKTLIKSKAFFRRNSPTILTCVGAVGVVATAVFTAKAALKSADILETAKEEKGEELTKMEMVKTVAPVYIPAIAVGVITISSIFGSNALNKKKQAALIGAYTALDQSFREYRRKIENVYGESSADLIKNELAKDRYEEAAIEKVENGKELFYDEYSKRYFESTKEQVRRAEYNLNRNLVMRDYAYLNEWYEELGIPKLDEGYSLGWSMGQCMDMYWQSWIDFTHSKIVLDNGRDCIIIRMMEEPIPDFENYG